MTRKKKDEVEEVVEEVKADSCPACNGTGSVPAVVAEDNKVEKWKNCPMCGAKGISPAEFSLPADACKQCNGSGQVPENFVNGKIISTKECASCKGTGTLSDLPEPVEE
jgi:DnaJ-class molecular chaperone